MFFLFLQTMGGSTSCGKSTAPGGLCNNVASDTLAGVHANAALQRGGWVDRKKVGGKIFVTFSGMVKL